jgi:hypothetical protein
MCCFNLSQCSVKVLSKDGLVEVAYFYCVEVAISVELQELVKRI